MRDGDTFYTRRGIARAAGCSLTRVSYVLNTRGIAPTFRAGGARVYHRRQVARILRELDVTAARPAPGRARNTSHANATRTRSSG
jgi:hypothetical protein